MADQSPTSRTHARPGAVLKALRAQRGWTLADVSERTGLPVSTLSNVETGKTDVTFERLVRISDGLGIDIAQLFGSTSAPVHQKSGGARRSVSRVGEGKSIDIARGNYLYLAAELLHKRFTPIIGEVRAKSIDEYDEFLRHDGDEFVFVIEGALELHSEMYTPLRLAQGESVYFDSGMGHAYIAVGDEPCRILSICAAPEAQLIDLLQESVQGADEEIGQPPFPGSRRVLR